MVVKKTICFRDKNLPLSFKPIFIYLGEKKRHFWFIKPLQKSQFQLNLNFQQVKITISIWLVPDQGIIQSVCFSQIQTLILLKLISSGREWDSTPFGITPLSQQLYINGTGVSDLAGVNVVDLQDYRIISWVIVKWHSGK